MSSSNYQIYFDFGFSKLRAGAFNKINLNETFHTESKFFFDHIEIDKETQKIIDYDVTPLVSENPRNVIDGKTIEIPGITTLKKSGFLSKLIGKLTD